MTLSGQHKADFLKALDWKELSSHIDAAAEFRKSTPLGKQLKKARARLDEKIDTLNQETQRLRAMRRRIERDQQAASTEIKPDSGEARLKRDAQETNVRRVTKLKILGITIAIVIVISILAWGWGLLSP